MGFRNTEEWINPQGG